MTTLIKINVDQRKYFLNAINNFLKQGRETMKLHQISNNLIVRSTSIVQIKLSIIYNFKAL